MNTFDGSRMISNAVKSRIGWPNVSEHVHGTKGTADWEPETSSPSKAPNPCAILQNPAKDAYQQEHDDLFAAS